MDPDWFYIELLKNNEKVAFIKGKAKRDSSMRPYIMLDYLEVFSEEFRRQKIGSALFKAFCNIFRAKGYKTMYLDALPSGHHPTSKEALFAFYTKLGGHKTNNSEVRMIFDITTQRM